MTTNSDREVVGHLQGSKGLYRCCVHCADDAIHDVPTDGHDLPCTECLRDAGGSR